MTSYINGVNLAAVNCFADLLHGCALPDLVFPAVRFPLRKARKEPCETGFSWSEKEKKCCRMEIQAVCVAEDISGNCLVYEERSTQVCQ